jgi:hypothetical protein
MHWDWLGLSELWVIANVERPALAFDKHLCDVSVIQTWITHRYQRQSALRRNSNSPQESHRTSGLLWV